MKIVQVYDFTVGSIFNLNVIPPEFQGQMGTVYHDLTGHPLELQITNGWRYIGGEFLPPVDISPTFGRIITRLAYRNRFNAAEKRALKKASLGLNLNLTEDQWLTVAVAQDDIMSAGYVHLDRPETISGTQALEALGLIGAGRSVEVLSPPVWSLELLAESRVIFGLPAVPTDTEMLANGGKGYSTVGQFMADHPNYGN